jgi:hypothetical protein
MMRKTVLCALASVIAIAAVPTFAVAQTACTYFKVNSSLLNISKDLGGGIFIDVLEDGEVACITKQEKKGGRVWGFIAHKLKTPAGTTAVNGWSSLRYMKKVTLAEAKAAVAAKAPSASAPVAPSGAAKPSAPQVATASPPAANPPAPARPEDKLRFDQPVPFGPFPVNGTSLKELAQKIPLFPPIKGLPDELWKKKCTTCHKWNQERLCAQGKTYVKAARHVLRHQHPYGGAYKLALMRWSKSGCE